jgi:hypothetical protein
MVAVSGSCGSSTASCVCLQQYPLPTCSHLISCYRCLWRRSGARPLQRSSTVLWTAWIHPSACWNSAWQVGQLKGHPLYRPATLPVAPHAWAVDFRWNSEKVVTFCWLCRVQVWSGAWRRQSKRFMQAGADVCQLRCLSTLWQHGVYWGKSEQCTAGKSSLYDLKGGRGDRQPCNKRPVTMPA